METAGHQTMALVLTVMKTTPGPGRGVQTMPLAVISHVCTGDAIIVDGLDCQLVQDLTASLGCTLVRVVLCLMLVS
jgi:hypothetical protein